MLRAATTIRCLVVTTHLWVLQGVGWLKDSEAHIAKALKGSAGESIPVTAPDSATAGTPASEEEAVSTKPTMSRVQQVILERQQLHTS